MQPDLELHNMDDVTAAGARAILAARKHAWLVAKVQGLPTSSWQTPAGRAEWSYGDSRGQNRAKSKENGKGKKGKNKWDGQNQWEYCPRRDWAREKDKPEEKLKA